MKKTVALILLALGAAALLAWRVAVPNEDTAALEARYLTPADRLVTVGEMRLRVREEGPEGAPVLLMLHGFTYSLETWDALARDLSSDFRIVRYDLLGHGLTGPDRQERYAPEDRAAFTAEVMNALGIERAVLVGNSLGGLVAWRFASVEPERVTALVLVSPGAYPMNGAGAEAAPVPPLVAAYLRTAPEAGVRAAAAQVYADPAAVPEARLATLRDMMRREGNGEAFVASLERFTLPDPGEALASIAVPTLIVWGAEDRVIPPAQGKRMAAVMPDARLLTYDGVGHVPQEEAPDRLAADMRAFLAALPSAPE
jgi:pimeloyl-ACP methyl ester carboxylesterase